MSSFYNGSIKGYCGLLCGSNFMCKNVNNVNIDASKLDLVENLLSCRMKTNQGVEIIKQSNFSNVNVTAKVIKYYYCLGNIVGIEGVETAPAGINFIPVN